MGAWNKTPLSELAAVRHTPLTQKFLAGHRTISNDKARREQRGSLKTHADQLTTQLLYVRVLETARDLVDTFQ